MIYIESVFCIDCWIIDPITMGEIRSQVMLLYQVDSKKFYNKKTQELLGQISKPDS